MNEHKGPPRPDSRDIAAIGVAHIFRDEGLDEKALASEMKIGDAQRAIAACEWMAARLEDGGEAQQGTRLRARAAAFRRYPGLAGEEAMSEEPGGEDSVEGVFALDPNEIERARASLGDALRVAIHVDPDEWATLAKRVQEAAPAGGMLAARVHFVAASGIAAAAERAAAAGLDAGGEQLLARIMFECALHGGILRARSWIGDLAGKDEDACRRDTAELLGRQRRRHENWPRLATFIGYRALIAREFDERFADELLMVADHVRWIEQARPDDQAVLYDDLLARIESGGTDRTAAATQS